MSFYVTDHPLDGQVGEVTVGGELDLHAAPEVKESLLRSIDAGARRLVVDLSDATFIDSTAIGVLVGARKRLDERGGSIHMACTNEHVLSVFEMAGLAEAFDVHQSREQALASARDPA